MTSDDPAEGYVWVWLADAPQPVVAGRLDTVNDLVTFTYGRSYLDRPDAVPLYLPELPLRPGRIDPVSGLAMAGVLADAGPDAWGRLVIERRLSGTGNARRAPSELDYLLRSGSDRIGALDFQSSPSTYVARAHDTPATLEQLAEAAQLLQSGAPLPPVLDQALLHGSSVGGARPKALLADGDRQLIAKFSAPTDAFPVVRGEFLAMELARRVGLDVASVELSEALGRDVLLVTRFDRTYTPDGFWARRQLVSALTVLELDELAGRYASYADLAEVVRARFTDARATLRELFARIVFNVLCGNTDDHARNHAAFWNGSMLTLTPAYDICPFPRSGGEAQQAMAIGPGGERLSQVAGCIAAAATYLLSEHEARAIVDGQITIIRSEWDSACDAARMSRADRDRFWQTAFLNPYALEGYAA